MISLRNDKERRHREVLRGKKGPDGHLKASGKGHSVASLNQVVFDKSSRCQKSPVLLWSPSTTSRHNFAMLTSSSAASISLKRRRLIAEDKA